jgi:pseudouridine synthase
MEAERLQKFMARCGVASRRKCEELIAGGLVEVNGEVIREPGVKIDPKRDRVRVDGKFVRAETAAYYAHYKVKGITTTVSDDLGRKTIMDCLPDIRERVYPVGRLDKDSEGLILLTNDGELANYVTHPAHGIEKTYRVVAEGRVPKETLDALAEKGMRLGPVLIRPTRVQLVRYDNENTVVLISVAEGINREVRRIFAALGHEVKKLLRTQIGPVELEGMKRGTTRPLTPREIAQFRKGMAGMDAGAEEKKHPRGSAASRKPTGPRGRTRPGAGGGARPGARGEKSPRQGKPDPAHSAYPAPRGGSGGGRGGGRGGKGKVTVDDWQKKTGPRRPTKPVSSERSSERSSDRSFTRAAKPKEESGGKKPLRTLRPTKRKSSFSPAPSAAPASKPTARPASKSPTARPERAPRAVSHPLAAPKPRPAAPVRSSGGRPATRPAKPRSFGKGKK